MTFQMNTRHQSYMLLFMALAMLISQVYAQVSIISMQAVHQPLTQQSHIHHVQVHCHDSARKVVNLEHNHMAMPDCHEQTDSVSNEQAIQQQQSSHHQVACQDCAQWHCQMNAFYFYSLHHALDLDLKITPDSIFNSHYRSQYIQQPNIPLLRPPRILS